MQRWRTFGVIFLCLIVSVLTGCGSSNNNPTDPTALLPTNESKVTVTQGVWGNVWFWEGDFMPPSTGKITPVVREVQIYKVTTLADLNTINEFNPLLTNIPTELVATTTSDETGFYQVNLQPGIYSVFIKEGTKYYAPGYDNDTQRIKPVEIQLGTTTKLQLDITYSATF